ncbi:molybdate ABC transporter substrate-binding protein [Sphingomonas sp.]|uniref:molybdate ABC transporter substrate-binding protein n=1 Tax=Sphingomonas sp. TaxID=28214 RepID=UPI002BABF211|nr:molybdate ABC transporter substrate-binding protein [Sphingomonas sp.]HTG37926.1 molybdate ABC transporter substrate-binding protein [Sphingomonas sp.]
MRSGQGRARRRALSLFIGLAAVSTITPAVAQDRPLVLAAASLQEALDEAATRFSRGAADRPRLSFAGSSSLARQIMSGAPADLFISADEAWMDAVERSGEVAPGTRAAMAGNRLVLIAPVDRQVAARSGADILRALGSGRLAMADPDAVPAGRYGRAALSRFGIWNAVAPRVARAENVRAALALVERGAATLGIVYATDAMASRRVRIVGTFPRASHPPIRYPIARLKRSNSTRAEAFRRFLLSVDGQAILQKHGFSNT